MAMCRVAGSSSALAACIGISRPPSANAERRIATASVPQGKFGDEKTDGPSSGFNIHQVDTGTPTGYKHFTMRLVARHSKRKGSSAHTKSSRGPPEVDMPEEGEGGGEGGGEMSLSSKRSSTAAPAMRASASSTTASTLLQLPAASSERSPSTPPARAIARA